MVEKKQKINSETTAEELIEMISGPSRITRKNASKALYKMIKDNPKDYVKFIPNIVDALNRPEAQTRWICLDCLTSLVPYDTKSCKLAIDGAEDALFDEKTSLIRESAIRFLCRYGASSKKCSKEVWPLVKEAMEQFHGEIEFDNMLNRINFFAAGDLDDDVKKDLRKTSKEIMQSVGGPTEARLERILNSTKAKKTSKKNNK